MRIYGLLGYPLDHSFSAVYFADKFESEGISDAVYKNIPVADVSCLREIVRENMLDGFNVTIPHKESIIPYLDELSPEAREIGAVNCVVRDGARLIGYNTDCYGFRESLLELIGEERPAALVLGSGGASKAVVYVLCGLGLPCRIVSSHPEKGEGYLSYTDLGKDIMATNHLIVNATPLGTFPRVSTAPDIPYELLTQQHYLYDLVYNPPLTRFLELGQEKGVAIRNGYRMLTLQADRAWEIFNGNR